MKKNLKFLISSVHVALSFSIPQAIQGTEILLTPGEQKKTSGMQLKKVGDDKLEAVLGTGNDVLLKLSMSLKSFRESVVQKHVEVPVRLYLTDFMSSPTNYPAVDLKVKVDCESTTLTCTLPHKPQSYDSYAQFTAWLNQGYFTNETRIAYDFHVDIQQSAPSLMQHLFAVLPGGYHFIGTHVVHNAKMPPDDCVPEVAYFSQRGTTNATTVTLKGDFYLNNKLYPVDDHQQIFPHPIIDQIVFKKDETKKFYCHKWLAQAEVTAKVTYQEFPINKIKDWPSAPSGTYNLLTQKPDDLEEIHHLTCWDGRSGEEVDISDGRIFLMNCEGIDEKDSSYLYSDGEDKIYFARFLESIVSDKADKLYGVCYFANSQINAKLGQKATFSNGNIFFAKGFHKRLSKNQNKEDWKNVQTNEIFSIHGGDTQLVYLSSSADLHKIISSPLALKHLDPLTGEQNITPDEKDIICLSFDKNITEIIMVNKNVRDFEAVALANNSIITSLNLQGNHITAIGAKELAKNRTITSLNLANNAIGDYGVTALANNSIIISLNLQGNHITAIGAKELARNHTITSLDLTSCVIGDVGATALAHNTTISSLNLSHSQIGPMGAKELAKNHTITSLDLQCCKIMTIGAKALANNNTITSLNLSHSQLGDAGAIALASNNTITLVNLNYNQIGDEGATALANNSTITTLSLQGNAIGGAGMIALANNNTITTLKLPYSNIGDKGIIALANNNTITSLDMTLNSITDAGAIALASNKSITFLNLQSNQIRDEGMVALAKNNTITSLGLVCNGITDAGMLALANNNTLTSLDLMNNAIRDTGAKVIAQALIQNIMLTTLNLEGNKIGEDILKSINDLLTRNKNLIREKKELMN